MIHLTGQNYNCREIIQNIFSPLVGAVTSPLADDICYRNNLSFVELLQPFSKLPCDAHFRDVSGTSVSIKGIRLNISDIDWRPPQTVLARKMLNEAVGVACNDTTKIFTLGSIELELPTEEPWFEKWRETFLTVQFPADHEFTRHFLSCLIVLSSGDPNIIETANKLTHRVQMLQGVAPQKLPKWFYPNEVLNSYVVLHEGSHGDLLKAQQSYELLKSTYGENKCFLIQLNTLDGSQSNNLPDYWAPFIKRQSKADMQDANSAPKTPQDSVSVISMPAMQYSGHTETGVSGADQDLTILHPLSPLQENAVEAINSKFSVSSESIASHPINSGVWPADMDIDGPHGVCLNSNDVENLRHFVQDYVVRALMPYVEHLVVVLNEAIANKKGVSKSLLSATKRWFVTNKPGVSATNQNAVIYTNESVELQTRKLGDLYFMFGHYNLAFQAYHQAKRDFNADAAWQYYAGALEMAAVSAFMLGTANRKTYDYMEDAIVCYLTVCKLQQFATRATLLSIECLKTSRLYGEAAKQLIRMTNEESDLRSALLLEQAAYCFLASQPCMHRKYAFHIVLAGNRYSRAGQRKHSYRCYKQAYQVFQYCDWSHAEDHIQYTMAKQACTLKKLEEASLLFENLLRPSSRQNAMQQANFLKEYIQTRKELFKSNSELGLIKIALPQVVPSTLRLLVTAPQPVTNPMHVPASNIKIDSNINEESVWHRIEEMIASTAANRPIVFKPSCHLFTKDNMGTNLPLSILGEPIEVSVAIFNTIKCSITFSEIDLLWQLKLENNELLSNTSIYESGPESDCDITAINAVVKMSCNNTIVLEEHEEKKLYFKLTPKLTGQLNIVGIVGKVAATSDASASLLGSLSFDTKKLSRTGLKTNVVVCDNKLSVKIVPPVPSLSVSFSKIPEDLVVGEIVPVKVYLRNTGILPINDIYIGCDSPRCITFLDNEAEPPLSILKRIKDLTNEKVVKDKEIRRQHVFRLLRGQEPFALKAQDTATIPMWIQAPYQKGEFTLRLLFYYGFENNINESIKSRLVRHSWKFKIHQCLNIGVSCTLSNVQRQELGLNVHAKNENEMHHPLMMELYINSLELFCSMYKVDNEKMFIMNGMEISTGQLGDRCLKSGKSAAFQFRLQNLESNNTSNLGDYVKQRLSNVNIFPVHFSKDIQIPKMHEIFSFLMKSETIYFNINATSEEFNNIVSMSDPHMTVAVNWTAAIMVNSTQRIAHGQHFVQLRNLYENVTCPASNTNKILTHRHIQNTLKLYDFTLNKENTNRNHLRQEDIFDNDDDYSWEPNNEFIGKRCLLEDEHFSLLLKA